MKPEDSDTRMLKGILNGNPPLSEFEIDVAINHAINNSTNHFNRELVSKQLSEKYHLEKYGYKLINILRDKINHQLTLSDIEKVEYISAELEKIEKETLSTIKSYEFRRQKDIKLVFIKLILLTRIIRL